MPSVVIAAYQCADGQLHPAPTQLRCQNLELELAGGAGVIIQEKTGLRGEKGYN
jgi:hypothetical protein